MTKYVKELALTFIEEKLYQEYRKQAKIDRKKKPVGKITEKKLRESLQKSFDDEDVEFTEKRINKELVLNSFDFIKAGVKDTPSFHTSLPIKWGQCDICVKSNGIEKILGEVKTTTSAFHNICGLINKNLSALRLFNKMPLSIVLYPGMKKESLYDRHHRFAKGLLLINKINKEEYKQLINCFFIIINETDANIKGKIKKIGTIFYTDIKSIANSLLRDKDIDYEAWNRLIKYISSEI